MRTRQLVLLLAVICLFQVLLAAETTAQQRTDSASFIPAPEEVLGFRPGDDRKLASWNQVLTYFEKLDQASDRVRLQALGKTTMDAPFVLAIISAPENLARLDKYRKIQELLADPRKLGSNRDQKARQLVARGKTIVLITCGIHSSEVGSTLSSMLIAHQLASSNEREVREILRNTIILLVPSLNPDGVDIVKNWYDKTLGTPYEGTEQPELYHKYVGHDNNRDWYAFTQVETKMTVDKIHNVWHPQIVHDIHQQGTSGSRLFLPPYMQPVEPNVPQQIVAGYTELGNWMANELRAQGFQGITTNSTYDAWTPARAYSHYHGGVRILSETASARIATPITVKFDELRSREGYDPKKASEKFGPVWSGGEWHLRDITNYMTAAAFALLRHASNNREQWLRRFYEVGKAAVRARGRGELNAFLIYPSRNRGALLQILERGGVKVDFYNAFRANGRRHSADTAVVRLAQPYGSFAKALLEPQRYPDLRDAKGNPLAPYDVTAHTLPLLMDVTVEPVLGPVSVIRLERGSGGPAGCAMGCNLNPPRRAIYKSHSPSMDEGWTRWVLENQRWDFEKQDRCLFHASVNDAQLREGSLNRFETIIIPDQAPQTILNGLRKGSMPPELTGGIGEQGVKELRKFVEQGGTLVLLNRASEFAIEQFNLPVRNVVAGLPHSQFYVPGSILRTEVDTAHPLAKGMPKSSIAWVEDSPAFEILPTSGEIPGSQARAVAWYPRDQDPLLSGWLLGADLIKGKAALVEVEVGKGRVILFGFRPQYRAQSLATYPLFFNAISPPGN